MPFEIIHTGASFSALLVKASSSLASSAAVFTIMFKNRWICIIVAFKNRDVEHRWYYAEKQGNYDEASFSTTRIANESYTRFISRSRR